MNSAINNGTIGELWKKVANMTSSFVFSSICHATLKSEIRGIGASAACVRLEHTISIN